MKRLSKTILLMAAFTLVTGDAFAQGKGKGKGGGQGNPGQGQPGGKRFEGPPAPRGEMPRIPRGEVRAPETRSPAVRPPGRTRVGIDPSARIDIREDSRPRMREVPSQFDNKFSRENYDRAMTRLEQVREKNRDWDGAVRTHYDQYVKDFYPRYERMSHYTGYYGKPSYRYYYRNYHRHGFYGGYYYPVRPYLNFGTYFYYPIGYWLFNRTPAPRYYHTYYGSEVQPFTYAGVLYPTDTLRDLVVDVSGMENEAQGNFREDINFLMKMLTQRLAEITKEKVTLEAGNVVITHYNNLDNRAIVIEGFVDNDDLDIHLPFKALLDLERTDRNLLFIPTREEPTDADLRELGAMNDRIKQLGGDPFAAHEEPPLERPRE
jgi:hypothetical protein